MLTWLVDVSRADVALADVDVLAWLLTWSDDVSSSVSVRGRCMLSPPAREGDARNPGGACDVV